MEERERERGGIGGEDLGFSTKTVASRAEERMKAVSAPGKEKRDHVWMEEWTK